MKRRSSMTKVLAVALVLLLGLGLGFGVALATPAADPGITPDSVELLPYGASGYRYLVFGGPAPATPPTDFDEPGFDDSGFSTGGAAFAHVAFAFCGLPPRQTAWPFNTNLVVRKEITVPAGATALRIMIAIDNDIEGVFFNGTQLTGHHGHEGCASLDHFRFDVPQALVQTGQNLVAIHLSDHGGATYFDTRVLAEAPSNGAPDCSNAAPSAASLWPPDHRFVPIAVNGVTDPDGDAVTIAVDSIMQDEAVNGKGDGNTSPDGQGVGSSTAEVRAERSGKGDGRVYEIGYTAADGNGGTCSGTVQVGVPHDKKDTAVNSGATYDSTTP